MQVRQAARCDVRLIRATQTVQGIGRCGRERAGDVHDDVGHGGGGQVFRSALQVAQDGYISDCHYTGNGHVVPRR